MSNTSLRYLVNISIQNPSVIFHKVCVRTRLRRGGILFDDVTVFTMTFENITILIELFKYGIAFLILW